MEILNFNWKFISQTLLKSLLVYCFLIQIDSNSISLYYDNQGQKVKYGKKKNWQNNTIKIENWRIRKWCTLQFAQLKNSIAINSLLKLILFKILLFWITLTSLTLRANSVNSQLIPVANKRIRDGFALNSCIFLSIIFAFKSF